eukprot:68880-Pleurochrysis_carterae.AAC.2
MDAGEGRKRLIEQELLLSCSNYSFLSHAHARTRARTSLNSLTNSQMKRRGEEEGMECDFVAEHACEHKAVPLAYVIRVFGFLCEPHRRSIGRSPSAR